MKQRLIIIAAILITVSSAIFQRTTGPTHPKKIKFEINNNQHQITLKRSGTTEEDCIIEFTNIVDTTLSLSILYRKYPTKGDWKIATIERKGKTQYFRLPYQAPAGKLEYFVKCKSTDSVKVLTNKGVVVRFKGKIPTIVLIIHIIAIFLAMVYSNITGLKAILKDDNILKSTILCLIFLIIGGFIFGPLVQYYAFGEAWTGFPFGFDLTDNKTLVALTFWLLALYRYYKTKKTTWIIIAFAVMLIVFMIPHSLYGSELNHTTGIISQG